MKNLLAAAVAVSIAAMPACSEDRVATARVRALPALRKDFATAGAEYPAGALLFRAFKREGELEMWVAARADGKFTLVKTYRVLARSGVEGPKRREGDRQVPEGFYEVDRFNPRSNFHLSLGLNYPNAADRVFADRELPGGDIFIHGGNVTVGCLPMGDEVIEHIFLAALDTRGKPVRAHIFPARMAGPEWVVWRAEKVAARPELDGFWKQLQPGYDAFERTQKLPAITVGGAGEYRVGGR